jgi:hypothetical protein
MWDANLMTMEKVMEMNSSKSANWTATKTLSHPVNFHLGMLHFAHLLVNADGVVDLREKKALTELQKEEQIPDSLLGEFQLSVQHKSEREVFQRGVDLLNLCGNEEKLRALAHLYCLAEADNMVHVKEVRLLLYSLKATTVDFDQVVMTARLMKDKAKAVR